MLLLGGMLVLSPYTLTTSLNSIVNTVGDHVKRKTFASILFVIRNCCSNREMFGVGVGVANIKALLPYILKFGR